MEQDNDAIASFRIRSGYTLAADAMLGIAQEAFADGSDEVAFYLRETALELRKKGEEESNRWWEQHNKT